MPWRSSRRSGTIIWLKEASTVCDIALNYLAVRTRCSGRAARPNMAEIRRLLLHSLLGIFASVIIETIRIRLIRGTRVFDRLGLPPSRPSEGLPAGYTSALLVRCQSMSMPPLSWFLAGWENRNSRLQCCLDRQAWAYHRKSGRRS